MIPEAAITLVPDNYAALSLEAKAYWLSERALYACDKAYAPYSNFRVGAALVLENGILVTGSNQEVAAYPSGLCAERVALFTKFHGYAEGYFEILAIAARSLRPDEKEVQPCGACREVMAEQFRRTGRDFWVALNPPDQVQPKLVLFSALLPGVFKF